MRYAENNNRLLWVDWLKVFAIIGVVAIHSISQFVNPNLIFTTNWYVGVVVESCLRYSVVLFIMASGFLILRKEEPITNIPRRFKRVFVPFAFWLIVYAIVKYFLMRHSLDLGLIVFIVEGFLDPTRISIQFWFVYMIIGLYILAPILSTWLRNSNFYEIEFFLTIWVVVTLIHFFSIDFLLYDYLRYFTGAIGYFILGYYLAFKEHRLLKSPLFGLFLFIIGTILAIVGTIVGSYITGQQFLSFLSVGELTPNACLQSIGAFIMIKNFNWKIISPKINFFAILISIESYGVYLSNILFINIIEKIPLFSVNGNAFIVFIVVSVIVLIVCNLLIYLMSKLPILNKFTGFKSIL